MVLINSYGVWTLEKLGYHDLTLFAVNGSTTETTPVEYALPAKASQGPDDWYMMHLHFRIEVADDSGDGFAGVTASTNGRTAAQVTFEVDNSPGLTWSSEDLLNGHYEETVASRDVEVRFSNYLQYKGVRPGENVLTFQLEQFEDMKVKSIRVFRDSGIEYTPLSPPKLKLEPELPDSHVAPGDVFEIGYKLKNVGDQPASDVAVGIIFPREEFALIGTTPHKYSSIRGNVQGVFTLKAIGQGTHRIALGVESPSGNPTAEIQADVGAPSGSFPAKELLSVVAPVVLMSSLAIAVAGRRFASSLRGGRR